ncbi:MAG: polyribonucleotide nucleotidyltransferase [Chitinispirillales bacterium]|jgi:polyribonucleotide nucleotidyltransferase|nr:polyribonucleotide nucleotidyltransferase [Chitinispirillales bacterium]
MTIHTKSMKIGEVEITLETGRVAKQAAGSATVRIGDSMVLSTVCAGPEVEGQDFFPLTVEYIEKAYAAGKIPGGFMKRESKPSDDEVLIARIIDRPIRPLFPDGYSREVQLVNTVISADEENSADVATIMSASLSLCKSDLPFNEPVAGVSVGKVDGELIVFPTLKQRKKSDIELTVAGTADSIMMVEGGAYEVPEEELVEAIMFAHSHIKTLVAMQKEMLAEMNIKPTEFIHPEGRNPQIDADVKEYVGSRLHEYSFLGVKQERYGKMAELKKETVVALAEKYPEQGEDIKAAYEDIEFHDMRNTILNERVRIGGRKLNEVRPIKIELDFLPRAHGSVVFTRGETQSLAVCTLGTKSDEKIVDGLQRDYRKTYYLHYNFPAYSVGECKRIGSVGRREIGHGHLAERALAPMIPSETNFPYTVRLVSEILESNGSSSMASVCGGSLALMAAGVPTKEAVAGVAMGLIKEGEKTAILTDILGTEDHLGDMDFKVTGTKNGVTAIQMDIKIDGITPELMSEALAQARDARMHILKVMNEAISAPRKSLSTFAPSILTTKIAESKIGELIGPGGKNIKAIQETTGAIVNISEDGTVQVSGKTQAIAEAAVRRIEVQMEEPEIGKIYSAKVKTIVDFGAFVEYLPGKEGLVHISELDDKRVENVKEYIKEGDTIDVKLIGLEKSGKVRLSVKAVKE